MSVKVSRRTALVHRQLKLGTKEDWERLEAEELQEHEEYKSERAKIADPRTGLDTFNDIQVVLKKGNLREEDVFFPLEKWGTSDFGVYGRVRRSFEGGMNVGGFFVFFPWHEIDSIDEDEESEESE